MAAGQMIASLHARISADVGDFEKALKGVKSDMGALEKTSVALGSALKGIFTVGAAGLAAFTGAVGLSVKAASDMEQGVADIGAMMTLTDAETQKLGDHIMDLGLDPTLKVTANEASAAIMALGTAGLTMSQIMGGASEATVLLANATGLKGDSGLAAAANIATDVMAQFNIQASNMGAAVDQISGTTIASKFSVDDYRLAIAQAGGVAGAVGLSFDDFNAIIAATSSSFASGSDAGTSLKTFLQRLVPTTNTAKDAMAALNLIAEDGTSKFFDASGAMKSAEEISGILATAFGGLSDAQKIEAASTIFGTDAMRTALGLAAGGTPIIQQMKDAIGKVDAEELAAKRMDTFKGSMEIAWGIIETLSIGIGQQFLPVLRPLVDTFAELAQTYGPSIVDFFGQVATQLATWITRVREVVTTGVGPFAEKLQLIWERGKEVVGVLGSFAASVFETLMPVTNFILKTTSAKDLLTALGILLAGPILAAIGGFIAAMWPVISTIALVTAAVTALRWAWQNDFGGIQTFTRNTLDKLTKWFYEDSGIWKGTWEKTLDYLKWWASDGWKQHVLVPLQTRLIDLKYAFQGWRVEVARKFEQFLLDLKVGTQHNMSLIAEKWRWMQNEVRHHLTVLGEKISFWVGLRKQDAKMFVNEWMIKIREWKDNLLERFEQVFSWWKPNEWLQKGRDIIQGLRDGIQEKWNNLRDWFSGVWSELTDRFKKFFGINSPSTVFAGYGENLMQGLEGGIDAGKKGVIDAIGDVAGTIDGKMRGLLEKTKADVQKILDEIAKVKVPSPGGGTTGGGGGTTGGGGQERGPQPKAPSEPGYLDLNRILFRIFGETSAIQSINQFAAQAFKALTAPGQKPLQGSSAAYQGYKVIDQSDVGNSQTGLVIRSIQALIDEIRNRGIAKIDTKQMEKLIAALQSGDPNAYGNLVSFMAGMR